MANKIWILSALTGLAVLAPSAVPPAGAPAFAQLQLGPPPTTQQRPPPPGQAAPAPRPPRPARPAAPSDTPPSQPDAPRERRQALPGETVAPAPDETVIAPPRQRISNPTAVFSGLDKITGRIISFDVAIDETVQFGALQVTPRVCYTRPPTETPQTTSFVEVDEVTLTGEVRRIYGGWMFAASPGLSGVEHAVYDVWLTDCKQSAPVVQGQTPAAPQTAPATPPQRR
ncbi:DUF2155 domain-containing protein [Phreatobacter cathodiphilus]|uniref:DUF2155 domain-containing protein n=1 Tax=Phreatobacter cathodiphilus TaxID=1868589 RepID=A0A2S0NHI1_9HYPH|nr:DUF2155 domain-containing protein [Phreatobacter cathodiphilus]AVO47393.1 hypothetical protein C6569_21395 [Phreatobacter cathodiphilus]